MTWAIYTRYSRGKSYQWLGFFRYRGDAIIAVRAMRKSKARHRRGHHYFYRKVAYAP